MSVKIDSSAEWLEADGLGGFASGTATTMRTRRYHGLLLPATTPPTGRRLLVNGADVWVEAGGARVPLSAQMYQPGVVHPDGVRHIRSFSIEPWPTWIYELPDGLRVRAELFVAPGHARTILRWTLETPRPGVRLVVQPLLSGRDYHSVQRENAAFRFQTDTRDGLLVWQPYGDSPAVAALTNGTWHDEPAWFRQFRYDAERERGLDDTEDLASPGTLTFDLGAAPAVWIVGTERAMSTLGGDDAVSVAGRLAQAEGARRAAFADPLHRAADAYLVRRGFGKTLVAGYPWFTDWGRDTFISLRGLCLATGEFAEARDILLEWSTAISEGMLPNRFPDAGEQPEYNAVDASLWFVVATWELLQAPGVSGVLSALDRHRLELAIVQILEGYARGTRFGIRCDDDGLLAAGVPGWQLTWMDARVDGRVITPRIGKPVEIQALWINALEAGAALSGRWPAVLARARAAFLARFCNDDTGGLHDVVDVDHHAGTVDATLRPNQILAVGGLPTPLICGDRARRVVDLVEATLWTPLGLRTLNREAPGYVPHYVGGPAQRDASYHQGTAWPWLLGAFVDAWVRVRGGTPAARREARDRFVAPLLAHLNDAGLGHVSEIVDADEPHVPRGCPFQAWSLGELIRMRQLVG